MMFVKMFTRSQSKISSIDIPLNEKGHPTIGILRPKPAAKPVINPYILECDSLEKTADMFAMVKNIDEFVFE
jgi:hypothetical protein